MPVIYLAQDSFGSAVDVVKKVEALMESDDVLCEDFLSETIVLPDKASGNSFSSNVKTRLQTSAGTWKIKNVLPLSESCNIRLPSGPYFILGFTLHQAWLLYDDYLDTFITTIVPDDNQPGRSVFQRTIWSKHLTADALQISSLAKNVRRWRLEERRSPKPALLPLQY